ncbi:MAG: hypothetical protein ABSF27_04360 [Candidatus Dormibacteria bacterium]
MTDYRIKDGVLELTLEGLDKLWAMRGHLTIPLDDITGVRADPEAHASVASGVKVAGARIPGVLQAGTFVNSKGMVFWDVHHEGHAIVISLQHEHFSELVVDVADPESAVSEIQDAIRRPRG